jgi:hypothetical protein
MSARLSFTAGFMVRRRARFMGESFGLKVKEFKGLLESGFVMEGDGKDIEMMWAWLEAQEGRGRKRNP